MDRGIPTAAVLAQMRASDPPGSYLVGTPKGALRALEGDLLDRPWETVRASVQVKLLPQDDEVYLMAQNVRRVEKERAILVAFMAYTPHVCLRQRLRAVAAGLTPRAELEKFCAVQMVDVHLPTTDGREVILMQVRLQRAGPYHACLFVFTHEPLVLLVGNRRVAAWNPTNHGVCWPNRAAMLPAHWWVLIVCTGEV